MRTAPRLGHHDLCFGCGQANLFGLQLEATGAADGAVVGRFFVKQDHQGPGGAVHPGVVAAALTEAMGLALGGEPARVEVELLAGAPVGTMVDVEATSTPDGRSATAVARGEPGVLARASATTAAQEVEPWPRT
jgi:acyl-coenzyme A thioesterase PaaI-like protein